MSEQFRSEVKATLTAVISTLTLAQLQNVSKLPQPIVVSGGQFPPALQMLPQDVLTHLRKLDSLSFGNCDGKQAQITILAKEPPAGDGTNAKTDSSDRWATHTVSVHRGRDVPGHPIQLTWAHTENAPVNQLAITGITADGRAILVKSSSSPVFAAEPAPAADEPKAQ